MMTKTGDGLSAKRKAGQILKQAKRKVDVTVSGINAKSRKSKKAAAAVVDAGIPKTAAEKAGLVRGPDGGLTKPSDKDISDCGIALVKLGFETVEHTKTTDWLTFICRMKGDVTTVFRRLLDLLLDYPQVEVGKRYMVREGHLVYGWQFRIPVSGWQKFVVAAKSASDKHPVKVTKMRYAAKLNPAGNLAETGAIPGTGAGVVDWSRVRGETK